MGIETSEFSKRMKRYEAATAYLLPRRMPVIIRIDGRAVHAITSTRWGKSYADGFVETMMSIGLYVANEIQGCTLAYGQSDEISFLLTDYRLITTDAWFGYDLNKVVSISAGLASAKASRLLDDEVCFDSRAFPIPPDEVCNYFIWRQRDATRNAILMAGQEHYSHKELHEKNTDQIQEMLFAKGVNFNDYPVRRKRGWCITNSVIDTEPPIFTQERSYIERHVFVRED